MKLRKIAGCCSALCLGAFAAQAQQTSDLEQLKRQLQQMQENFEKMQREQREQIDSLTKKLEEITKQQAAEAEKKKLAMDLYLGLALDYDFYYLLNNDPPGTNLKKYGLVTHTLSTITMDWNVGYRYSSDTFAIWLAGVLLRSQPERPVGLGVCPCSIVFSRGRLLPIISPT